MVYKRRRTNLEIIMQILTQCLNGAKKTHIVYNANLNFQMLNRYLTPLLTNGMLKQEDNLFVTTELGKEFLNKINSFDL